MEHFSTRFDGSTSPPQLCVEGELDLATMDELRAALEHAIAVDPSVVVDLEEVVFIDACGLRAILEAASTLNGAGPLTLSNARLVARLLSVVGLDEVPSLALRGEDLTHG